jgi:flavin reductase (DIM6/NTAB) family NADH-FMN oxidoreductase RutF
LHTQFVGEVVDVKVDEEALGSDGAGDIKKIKPLVFTPDTQSYYGIGSFIAKAFSVGEKI